MFTLFKKRNWGQWKSIMFVEDFRAGIETYELLRREDFDSGLIQWKRVYVKSCVLSLSNTLNDLLTQTIR